MSVLSDVVTVHTSSILSTHPSDIEHQEIPDNFPFTNYGEKLLLEITTVFPSKILDGITLTLNKMNFLTKIPHISNGAKYLVEFPSGQKQVKFLDFNP